MLSREKLEDLDIIRMLIEMYQSEKQREYIHISKASITKLCEDKTLYITNYLTILYNLAERQRKENICRILRHCKYH